MLDDSNTTETVKPLSKANPGRYSRGKIPEEVVQYILRNMEESSNAQAKRFNINRRTIARIKNRESYQHIDPHISRKPQPPSCYECSEYTATRGCSYEFPESVDPAFGADCVVFQHRNNRRKGR